MLERTTLRSGGQVEAIGDDAIATRGLRLSYGAAEILRGIDLKLAPGKALALLGPSGSGKTTLLRVLAGLEEPDAGEVLLGGRPVADPARGIFVPPERRGLGMVFQDYALWPHMDVARNVAFPLEMMGVGRADREKRTHEALARVGLADMGGRRPSALSGGQQQRVGIARAIVSGARTVLFDEPLSNLDRELRETMVDEIAGLVADLGLTALYVTHDHSEAFSLADEVAVLRDGKIVQSAPPETLVDAPVNAWVAEFLRLGAVLPVTRGARGWMLPGGILLAPVAQAPGHASHVLVPRRAMHITSADDGILTARVLRCLFRGDEYQLTLALPDGARMQIRSERRLSPETSVGLRVAPEALRWFDEPSDA
ncbi:MAG: ABC transporter ATP-binding protein [Rhodobiaceae bacterium]|nr:ABC transporter ATP-binding protein [Rhodobiaceae bacterium]